MQSSNRNSIQSSHKSDGSITPSRMNKENGSEKIARAGSTQRAQVNVFTDEDRSYVPFFVPKKKVKPHQMQRDAGPFNELVKKRTTTIEENFASGKWLEIPRARVLPDPPLYWRKERLVSNSIEDEEVNDSFSSTEVSFNNSFCCETLLSLNSVSGA